MFLQITDELSVLFRQRGWSLDTTINIKSDSEPFSHEAAFALVCMSACTFTEMVVILQFIVIL